MPAAAHSDDNACLPGKSPVRWVALGVLAMAVVALVGSVLLPRVLDPWAPLSSDESVDADLAGYFPASDEQPLAKPLGIAIVGSRVYIAESGAGRVAIFTAGGKRTGEIVLRGAEGGAAAAPIAVEAAGSRKVAILDATSGSVLVYSTPFLWMKPRLLLTIGEADARTAPQRATAVAYSEDEYYVADAGSGSVRVYDAEGTFVREIASGLEPPIGYAGDMVVDGERLVIADSGSDRVVSVSLKTDGDVVVFPDAYALPRGVCSAEGGVAVGAVLGAAVYVCEADGLRTHVIDADTMADWPPSSPEGVAWHGAMNRLYVTEPDYGRVVIFNVRME